MSDVVIHNIENLNVYQNTFFFSMENPSGHGDIRCDFFVSGDLGLIARGLAEQIRRHPELKKVLEFAISSPPLSPSRKQK